MNKEGERVVEGKDGWVKESVTERQPFLDDDDNPIEARLNRKKNLKQQKGAQERLKLIKKSA